MMGVMSHKGSGRRRRRRSEASFDRYSTGAQVDVEMWRCRSVMFIQLDTLIECHVFCIGGF